MNIDLSQLDPRLFHRMDDSADSLFYARPRKVVHIDEGAIEAVTDLYRELLPERGSILDLMSSWRSHLPPEVSYERVCGLGMNTEELDDNPQLSERVIHDLNHDPRLPFDDDEFDGVCCCVSVQYLQHPQEIFAEVARVLTPGGPFIVTFSNRCFPTKAINIWRTMDDKMHVRLVQSYFDSAAFSAMQQHQYLPSQSRDVMQDPLYAVWASAS